MPMVKDPDGRAGWKNPKPAKEEKVEPEPVVEESEPAEEEEKPKRRYVRRKE